MGERGRSQVYWATRGRHAVSRYLPGEEAGGTAEGGCAFGMRKIVPSARLSTIPVVTQEGNALGDERKPITGSNTEANGACNAGKVSEDEKCPGYDETQQSAVTQRSTRHKRGEGRYEIRGRLI